MSEIQFCGLFKEGAIKLCSFYNEVIHFNFNMSNKKNKGSTKKT